MCAESISDIRRVQIPSIYVIRFAFEPFVFLRMTSSEKQKNPEAIDMTRFQA